MILRNERVEGEVGPYREVLSQICMELQSGALPLLIPCPNKQLAGQTIGVGENRDKFILRPSATSPNHLVRSPRELVWLVGRRFRLARRCTSSWAG